MDVAAKIETGNADHFLSRVEQSCGTWNSFVLVYILLQLTKEVTSLKMTMPSDTQSRELAVQHGNTILMLENRVEVATKRFNLVIASNAKLRAEIETMLRERAQFTQLWNKLIGQLNTGKQVINDLIEQATITFNQRDEELNKIQALRERCETVDFPRRGYRRS